MCHQISTLVVTVVLLVIQELSNVNIGNADTLVHIGREYCLAVEPFQAQCHTNEVVIMNHAMYGRMKVGRCLQHEGSDILGALGNDPRFLGCSVDVLAVMDKRCTGHNRCSVEGNDDVDFRSMQPCHLALKSYLEVDYDCVAVVQEDRSCTVSVTSSAQHLMTSHSSSTKLSCGSRLQPWKLEAPAGQQINVSLLDHGGAVNQRERDSCLQYGYIVDREAKKNVSICGLNSERRKYIYQSTSNTVEIYTNNDSFKADQTVFIGFVAIGCLNAIPPAESWLRRNGNTAIIGCHASRQTWQLRCVDSQWIGVIGNCTREAVNDYEDTFKDKERKEVNFNVVVIVLIVVVTCITCVLIICTGAICLKRYFVSAAKNYSMKFDKNMQIPPSSEKHFMLDREMA